MEPIISIPIMESKDSEKVVKFLKGQTTIDLYRQLLNYVSRPTARKIINCYENGSLWSLYLNDKGQLKATFI